VHQPREVKARQGREQGVRRALDHRPRVRPALAERATGHDVHHDEGLAPLPEVVAHAHHARHLRHPQRRGLAPEPVDIRRGRDREPLDRHLLLQDEVVRQPHLAERADAEAMQSLIPPEPWSLRSFARVDRHVDGLRTPGVEHAIP
jgi:hypothetical protein